MLSTSGAEGFDATLFEDLARVESKSFWFRARNRLVVSAVRRWFPDARSLLDVGCGTGVVLEALRVAFPQLRLTGVDAYEEALAYARARVVDANFVRADARELPFESEFDVVGAFDVLEHVEDDERALRAMARACRPRGGVIVLVPQHPRLWSPADDLAHHVRRYGRRDLLTKMARAGFAHVRATSFVTTLLPALALSRIAARRRGSYDLGAQLLPPRPVNALFERLLDIERAAIDRGLTLPAGGSLLVVSRRVD